jgi:hypothetical protein
LIIVVYACYTIKKYRDQINIINSTWGKKCKEYKNILLLYFLGNEKIEGFNDTTFTKYINLNNVKDDYLSASYKQFLGLKHVYENYTAKYIICIGTDTYLNIPKLLSYINKFDETECLYIGGHGDTRKIGLYNYYFHSGGPGFIITHSTLVKIYYLLPNIVDEWIKICNLNKLNELITACDVAIGYYLQQPNMNIKIIIEEEFLFLHCNYKGFPCHIGMIKMSNIISCHGMNKYDFCKFTRVLDDNNYYILDKLG